MSLYLNLDAFQHDNLRSLASHTSVWSVEEPFTVSSIVNLPKPIYATLNNFLNLGLRAQPVSQENIIPRHKSR